MDEFVWCGMCKQRRPADRKSRARRGRPQCAAAERAPQPSQLREGLQGVQEGREGPQVVQEGREGLQEGCDDWKALEREQESRQDTEEQEQEQYCSSCTQKKPLLDFGRFLTCNTCRRRNAKAKQGTRRTKASIQKQKLASRPTREQLEKSIRAWSQFSGEDKLKRHSLTRPLTVEDYLKT
jgi:hypothetical protein